MRKSTIIKFYLFTSLFTTMAFVTTCSSFSGIVYWNDEIKQATVDEVHLLNEILVSGIKNNMPELILDLATNDLAEDQQFQQIIRQGFGDQFTENDFLNIHDYHILLNKTGNFTYQAFSLDEDAPFIIHVPARSTEMYVSLLVNEKPVSQLLLVFYIKEKEDWKLESFHFVNFAWQGLDALQLYEKANILHDEGFTVPAMLYLKASVDLVRPSPILQYKEEAKIVNHLEKVTNEVVQMFKFPIQLPHIINEPVLYGIDLKILDEGFVPVIIYITNLNLDDPEGLKEEAYQIATHINTIFPGVTQNFSYIIFRAVDEAPENPNIYYDARVTVVDLSEL